MAKLSVVQRNLHREILVSKYSDKRKELKAIAKNKSLSIEERFKSRLELSSLPKNSSPVRVRNRCNITGRGRGYYRKFKMSRICLRSLASKGQLPGVIKASW